MNLTLTAFHLAVLLLAALLLLAAAVNDARHFRIPNLICAALVALFPAYGLTAPASIDWLQHLIVFGLVLAAGFVLFLTGLAGAGDFKLLAATSLWAGPHLIAVFLLTTAVAGGVLALGMFATVTLRRHAARRASPNGDLALSLTQVPMPYGIAIATGGLCLIYRLSQPLLFPG